MSITGLKDVDREILRHVDDKELLRICSLNRKMWYEVCDDNFLRRRLGKYSNVEKCRKENETWKQFYLRMIHYIEKLKGTHRFIYSDGDFSLQYDILKNSGNANDLLNKSSTYGELSLVKFALAQGAKIHPQGDVALGWAAENGHLHVVKYLVEEQNANLSKDDDFALRWASGAGYLDVVKYLVEQGANIHERQDGALRQASEGGHLQVVKYLLKIGANVHAREDHAVRMASSNGHLDVVKYLVEQGADIHASNTQALRLATEKGHIEIVKYLSKI